MKRENNIKNIKLIILIILIAILLALFVRIFVSKYLGYPTSIYWGAAFFSAGFALIFFAKDALKETRGVKNFLQKKYYFSLSGVLGVFIVLPLIFILLKVLLGNIFITPEEEVNLASSVFVGSISEVSKSEANGLPFDMVKLEPLRIIKGGEFRAAEAKAGFPKPEGCKFEPLVGEYYLVFLRRNKLGFNSISCTGIKKLSHPEQNVEVYLSSAN